MQSVVLYRTVFGNGERFPVLLDRATAQPLILPTRYAIGELRQRLGDGSMRHHLQVIGWFYEWSEHEPAGTDLRLRNGPFFSQAEIGTFARYLRAGREEKVIAILGHSGRPISANTFNNYWDALRAYLLWAMWTFHRSGTGSRLEKNYENGCREIKFAFKAQAQRSVAPKERPAYNAEEAAELISLLKPGTTSNPFRQSIQFRNYVILKLMLETGFRRGEIGALYIEDLETRGAEPVARVVRRHDDHNDPRREEPKAKTRERTVAITRSIAAEITEYIAKHRPSARHPFVFTSNRKNAPLGVRQINRIFEDIGRSIPKFAGIEAHDTRRTFNNIFDKFAREEGLKEEDMRALQIYVNGWVPGSQQPEIYARRAIQEKAIELSRVVQSRLYGH